MENFRPVQLLLVEDDENDIEITRRALQRSRVANEVAVARDGQEALDVLFQRRQHAGGAGARPDVIFLDLNLPRVDGMEVARQVRQDDRLAATPIIMLTNSNRDEDVVRSYRAGVNTYIQKSVEFAGFVKTVDVIVEYWFTVARLPRAA